MAALQSLAELSHELKSNVISAAEVQQDGLHSPPLQSSAAAASPAAVSAVAASVLSQEEQEQEQQQEQEQLARQLRERNEALEMAVRAMAGLTQLTKKVLVEAECEMDASLGLGSFAAAT
eukprot:TRINITY_DN3098_c3_g1_i1.p1 TRINITY_DN3098_c3_g1~~TRINITY_DN3098_c3_g1_i1.p1  ORF type:complete len:131 (-),score=20.43 TRINITY_DN3098_c3_g1_i1:271-630(-)